MTHHCPNCNSTDVCVGAFVLECLTCGWHYLNKDPCSVCGEPSRSGMGAGGKQETRCAAHPFTTEEIREAFRGFLTQQVTTGQWSRAVNGERVFQ